MSLSRKIVILGLIAVSSISSIAKEVPKSSVNCVACHMGDGNSVSSTIPKIAGLSYGYFLKQMYEFRKGNEGNRNNPIMYPLSKALSENEIDELAKYYSSQKMSAGEAEDDNIKLGEKIYRQGNKVSKVSSCSACHLHDGKGNDWAKFPQLAGQHAEYIAAQLYAFKEGTRSNSLNAMMSNIASRMTDEEIEAVSNYISGLR